MELRPFSTAGRDDRSLVVAPHLHGRGPRKCHRLTVCDLASPQLQETPEIVGVASNTELRFRSDQRLASLKVVPFSVIRGRAVCVERRTYGSWGGAHREVGPYPPDSVYIIMTAPEKGTMMDRGDHDACLRRSAAIKAFAELVARLIARRHSQTSERLRGNRARQNEHGGPLLYRQQESRCPILWKSIETSLGH